MKKFILVIPLLFLSALVIFFVVTVRGDISTFEKDLTDSYHFSGFLNCKFPATLNPDFKNLYSESCLVRTTKDQDRHMENLKPFLEQHIHSPLMRMRPFRPHNMLLSIHVNKEYIRFRDYLLQYADTEQSIAQIRTNFMEADCSPGKMKDYLEFAENIQNHFTRMYVLSEIKSCMYINNLEDPGLIQTLLSLSPSKVEDESAGIIQLREYLIDQNNILKIFPVSVSIKIADLLISGTTRKKLTDLDTYFYYDEMSQLHYLTKEYKESLRYANLAQEMNIRKYNVENFEILNYMTLARLGKIYLQLGQSEVSKQIFKTLDKENEMYKKLPDVYYIDLSLAELFLQSEDIKPALSYLESSYKKKYVPEALYRKWTKEIENSKTAKLDLDMFRFVNKKSIESKIYKNEENQIILFKDKLKPVNQSLR